MTSPRPRFYVCLSSEGYPASLEPRKIYLAREDADAEALGMLRVVDESGEDYLYPASCFARVEVSDEVARRLTAA